jgi:hypothetical protein
MRLKKDILYLLSLVDYFISGKLAIKLDKI